MAAALIYILLFILDDFFTLLLSAVEFATGRVNARLVVKLPEGIYAVITHLLRRY